MLYLYLFHKVNLNLMMISKADFNLFWLLEFRTISVVYYETSFWRISKMVWCTTTISFYIFLLYSFLFLHWYYLLFSRTLRTKVYIEITLSSFLMNTKWNKWYLIQKRNCSVISTKSIQYEIQIRIFRPYIS